MPRRKSQIPEKKRAIFEAAINLISQNGFHASPTAKIAEEAGIGIGTMYRYFESKDQLINDLFEYIEGEMNAAVTRGQKPEGPIPDQFVFLCHNLIRYSFDNPKKFNFFTQYIESPYGTALRKFKRERDADNIPTTTLLYPFYHLFSKAKKQRLVKNFPNILLYTLINGTITNFIRDIMIGVLDYDKATEDKVVQACWDMVKK